MKILSMMSILAVMIGIHSLQAMHSPPATRHTPPTLAQLASRIIANEIKNHTLSSSSEFILNRLLSLSPDCGYGHRFLKELGAANLKNALALTLFSCTHTLNPLANAHHVYFKKDQITLESDFCSPDGTLGFQEWSILTGKELLRCINGKGLQTPSKTYGYYFTFPNAERSCSISVRDSKTHKELKILKGHTAPITCISVSPDQTLLASSSDDHTIKIWDIKTGTVLNTLTGHLGAVNQVEFRQPSGELLASCGDDKTVKVWESHHGTLLRTLSFKHAIKSIVFSPHSFFMAVGLSNGTIEILDYNAQKSIKVLKGHDAPVTWLTFNRDGSMLASVSDENTIKLWSAPPSSTYQLKKLSTLDMFVLHYNLKEHPIYEKLDPELRAAWAE